MISNGKFYEKRSCVSICIIVAVLVCFGAYTYYDHVSNTTTWQTLKSYKFKVQRKFYKSNGTFDTLTFQQLLLGTWANLNKEFAIVIPDGLSLSKHIFDFSPLLELLKNNEHLIAIAGATVLPRNPICTLIRNDWSLKLFYNYSKFGDGSSHVKFTESDACYSCDVLPDVFFVDLTKLVNYKDDIVKFKKLEKSAHLAFFLLLKNHSAYCPTVNMEKVELIEDYSCNNLSIQWDERMPFFPNVTGIYRITTPDSVDTWIGCLWAKEIYEMNLMIHCSNFIRQYLFDLVDIIENEYRFEYRVVFGSLIGALRDNDIIPWSVDVDLYLKATYETLKTTYWPKLPSYSNRRYSSYARDGNTHYSPLRAFAICPISLRSNSYVNSSTSSELISNALKNTSSSSSGSDWRSFGYVDIYSSSHLGKCFKPHIDEDPEIITIANRTFNTIVSAHKSLICAYGDYMKPSKASNADWQYYVD